MSLNEKEFAFCRNEAISRARKHIKEAFATPGKTLIPKTIAEALEQAVADVDAMLSPYKR